jgi:hypothetical protein
MSSDIIITIVYLAQDQFETFVEQIKASDLPKPTQWDLIDLLKTARQHTEHAVDGYKYPPSNGAGLTVSKIH